MGGGWLDYGDGRTGNGRGPDSFVGVVGNERECEIVFRVSLEEAVVNGHVLLPS